MDSKQPSVRSAWVFATLLCTILLASSCANPPTSSTSSSQNAATDGRLSVTPPSFTFPAPIILGDLTSPETIDSAGIVLTPPLETSSARLSYDAAYTACGRIAKCPRVDEAPTAMLASYVNTLPGHDSLPKLVYVFRWKSVPFVPAGPPGSDDTVTTSTFTTLIDATTGDVIVSVQAQESGG